MSETATKLCAECKFYKPGAIPFFSSDVCTNANCDTPAFMSKDYVSGETKKYETRHIECRIARIHPCGKEGKFWSPSP